MAVLDNNKGRLIWKLYAASLVVILSPIFPLTLKV